jgi:hypothetical protein
MTRSEYPFVSDHAPILLQLENITPPIAYPYKFNPHCLSEKDYNSSVKILWNNQLYLQEVDIQRRFIWKLQDLKVLTKNWYKEQRSREFKHLQFLETRIIDILKKNADGFTHSANESLLIRLETDRNIF